MPSSVFTTGTGRPKTSIQNCPPRSFSRAFFGFSSCGLKMPSLRPLAWAFSPATALPKVGASSSSKPSAGRPRPPTASNGHRLIEMVFAGIHDQGTLRPDAERVGPSRRRQTPPRNSNTAGVGLSSPRPVYSLSAWAFLWNNSNQPRVRASPIAWDRRSSSGDLPQ